MTHISNLLLISSLNDSSLYEKSTRLFPKLNHLGVLRSTIYIFVHKKNGRSSLLNESHKQNPKYLLDMIVIQSIGFT